MKTISVSGNAFEYLSLLVSLFIVLSISGGVAYYQYQKNLKEAWAEKLAQAITDIDENSWQEAEKPIDELITTASSGYKSLAQFQKAAIKLKSGDKQEALRIYQKLQTEAPTQSLRDIALILWAYYQIDTSEIKETLAKIERLMQTENPWRPSALEIGAYLHLRDNNTAEAEKIFLLLTQENTIPQGIQKRARDMLALMKKKS